MNTNTNFQNNRKNYKEVIKWIFSSIILIIDIVINHFFLKDLNFFLRGLVNFFIILISISIIMTTTFGKIFLSLIKSTYFELNKIIWPTIQETFYASLVVVIVTIFTSLLLWGIDNILFHFISFITRL